MTDKQVTQYVTDKDQRDLMAAQALKFLLQPAHVTDVVLFALSKAASAMTGQNLVVDCGKVMS